ncbi:MAG: hydrogenase expression/formation protein HypE, partial [Gammaproteobacteria bacterium]
MDNNKNKFVTLAHGNGGRFMRELIDDVFKTVLSDEHL